MNKALQKHPGVQVAGLVGILVAGLTLTRALRPAPSLVQVDPDVVATQGFNQGREVGASEGYEAGQRDAITPAIGSAHQSAALALAEADAASLATLNQYVCARKGAWLDYADQQAAQGKNPIVELDRKLKEHSVDPFKDLTVAFGTITAKGEQHEAVQNPVIENRAIVLAISELRGTPGTSCVVDLTAAHTANVVYLFESQRALTQRNEIMQEIDQLLTEPSEVAQDETD